MGFNIHNFFKHPGRTISHAISNPANALLGDNIRRSSIYKNIARPLVKGAVGAGEGFFFGGLPGALAGGVTGITSHGAFQPIQNVVMPAATGALAGFTAGAINGPGSGGFAGQYGAKTAQALSDFANVGSGVASGASTGVTSGAASGAGGAASQAGSQAATQGATQAATQGAGQVASGAVTNAATQGTANAVSNAAAQGIDLSTGLAGAGAGGASATPATFTGFLGNTFNTAKDYALAHPLNSLALATQVAGALQSQGVDPAQVAAQGTAQQLLSPTVVSNTLSQLSSDPNIKKQIDAMHQQLIEQVRSEYLNTYGASLSQSGGFGGSQQAQLEQAMQADLINRMQRNDQQFLLKLVSSQLGVNQNAVKTVYQHQHPQPTALQDIAGALQGLA